jgi:thiamine biosynthesis protein ThiI
MGLILIRYGEIALKGQNRNVFFRILRRNVRLCLKANGIAGKVWQEGQRIYLSTDEVEPALEAVRRVFGIVSLSAVHETAPEMQAITDAALQVAESAGLNPTRTFRVRARRADKAFPLTSPEINRHVGGALAEAIGARVDLSNNTQVDIGIEVHPQRALVYGDVVRGPGGMPLGSQGRVVVLLSSGIDSPVAAWLMMKRGCTIIPVHFSISEAQSRQVQSLVDALNRYAYGWQLKPIILSHHEILGPALDQLRAAQRERWACLFCKRAMLIKAAEIAAEMNASAVVTGDSLGQVASQTLSNLEVVSHGVEKPILRPLIALDKVEIMALARQIGTYEPSVEHAHSCPFLPDRPLTQGSIEKLQEVLDRIQESQASSESSGNQKRRMSHVRV